MWHSWVESIYDEQEVEKALVLIKNKWINSWADVYKYVNCILSTECIANAIIILAKSVTSLFT